MLLRDRLKVLPITLVLLISLASTIQGYAGELECTFACEIGPFGSNIEWKSTDCSKPFPPSLIVVDADSFNWAVDEFNGYVARAQIYIDCLISEAEGDLRELPDIISAGVERAREGMLNEVNSARSDLEFQRTLLQ